MQTERLESMSPRGFLRMHRQQDGDIVITVGECDASGRHSSFSTVEFCTSGNGGGGSRATYEALIQLMGAMAADNLDARQAGRRPPQIDDGEQARLVKWSKDCKQSEVELRRYLVDEGLEVVDE